MHALRPHSARLGARPAAPALLALLAACAGDPAGPTPRDRAADAANEVDLSLLRPSERPSFGVVADGRYWDGFNFLTNVPPWPAHPPTHWSPSDFDVAIHSRDQATWYTPEPFRAMHGADCTPYQTDEPANEVRHGDAGSHPAVTYEDLNFRCRNHMMTAIKASGYGVVYLTPNALVDFTNGEASIKFALSTLRSSPRDWVDLWITPWDDNLVLPLDGSLAASTDLQGPPRTAIHVRMAADPRTSRFEAYVVNHFTEGRLPVVSTAGYERILLPVSTRRDTFELRISRYRLRFGMKKIATRNEGAGSLTWVDAPVRTAWTRGVVQFGHHSHNPELGGGTANTWHWDDFAIAPAVPFSIIRPVRTAAGRVRYVDAQTAATPVEFERPAPAGAYLRFAAYGAGIQVSVDGGQTWADARRQPAAFDRADRFRSYWTPIPDGVSSLRFRQAPGVGGVWFVRDMSIWSLNP
jgi:hypothetical protein